MKAITPPHGTPDTWNAEALFAKALRYSEKMHESDPNSWEQLLWSSLMLEFLLRAALANVSPILIADTTNKIWSHLYVSLGFDPFEEKYSPKSIATSVVISRLLKIVPEFNKEIESFCSRHIGHRNAELHSGDNPFDGMAESDWLPDFYRTTLVLLKSVGLKLEDFFEENVASTAGKLIEAAADEKAKEAKGIVKAHKKVWEAKPAEEQEKLQNSAKVWAMKQDGHRVDCPACGSKSLLFGDSVSPPKRKLKDNVIEESLEMLPTHYECVACELKIKGLSRLSAVGLGDRYKKSYTFDPAEFYAPDDEYPGYEEDYNEPF